MAEVQACSPLLAREVVFGVHGDAQAPVAAGGWEAIAGAFAAVWRAAAEGRWGPSVAVDGERLLAYAGYPLRSFPDAQAVTSISRAVERWFAQSPAGARARAAARRFPGGAQGAAASVPRGRTRPPASQALLVAAGPGGRAGGAPPAPGGRAPAGLRERAGAGPGALHPARTTRRSWRSIPA